MLVQINCEKGDGGELAKEFNIKAYPTFVIANAKGETIYRWWGYTKEMLFSELARGLSDPTTIEQKETRYKKSPDATTARTLAFYHQTNGNAEDALSFYLDAAKYDPDDDYADDIYQIYSRGYRRGVYDIKDLQEWADKALASTHTDIDSKTYIYVGMARHIASNPADSRLLGYVKDGYQFVNENADKASPRIKNELMISYVLYVEKNIERAVGLKKEGMDEGWMDNAGDLNGFSWWCFENKVNLEEAETLALRGVNLAAAGREKAMILDTAAEIMNLRGKPEDAVKTIELAIKEDPNSDSYKKQLERFRKAAN